MAQDVREEMGLRLLGDPAVLIRGSTQGVEPGEMRPCITDPDPALVGIPARWAGTSLGHRGDGRYLSRSAMARTAWAAASRATGTRNGEHDT